MAKGAHDAIRRANKRKLASSRAVQIVVMVKVWHYHNMKGVQNNTRANNLNTAASVLAHKVLKRHRRDNYA